MKLLFAFLLALLCFISYAQAVKVNCTITPYSSGCPALQGSQGPTQDEAYSFLLINLARSNSTAEGQRLASITDANILRYISAYGVNLNTLKNQFNTYRNTQPLAWNPLLYFAAKVQSNDMATYGYQGHQLRDGRTFDQVIAQQGYLYHALGQNVYAYCSGVYFCHAGLNIDWGVPSLDHRANIMNTDVTFPLFQEIGVSISSTSFAGFGPIIMAQNFGTPAQAITAFVGVTYSDTNGDSTFTSGEGVGGVAILFTANSGSKYKVITLSSGYYRADLPSDCYTIKFNSEGFSIAISNVCIAPGSVIQITARNPGNNGGIVGTNGVVTPACEDPNQTDPDSDSTCDDVDANYNYAYNGTTDAAGDDTFVFPAFPPGTNYTIASAQTNDTDSVLLASSSTSSSSSTASSSASRIESLLSYLW